MKYNKVSVVKKIMLLLMTMALAVAMVACESATGAQGDLGPQGDPGDTGPAGPSGTTDNEPPMVTKPLPMVYLAMAGTGVKKTSDALDLSKHFADTEKASLNYEFESSDKDVATAELSGGKMVVKGKKAGPATITVMVYDGVTDPISETFDVMVVLNNAKPVVDLDLASADTDFIDIDQTNGADPRSKLGKALYRTSGGGSVTEIAATIHAGAAGNIQDAVTFEVAMGADGTDDDIVKVNITAKAGVTDVWKIALTPVKEGKQNVYVTVKDKFGVTAETPEDVINADGEATGDDVDNAVVQRFQFVAFVNTVPKLAKALPAKTFIVNATAANLVRISEHFDTSEVPPAEGPKVGGMEKPAAAPGTDSSDVTAGHLGPAETSLDAASTACTITTSDARIVDVNATDTGSTFAIPSATDQVTIIAVKAGTADVTITCRDDEDFATDTATITVRAVRG